MTRAMKDSSVEWIGLLPNNYKIMRCKYISEFLNGYAFDSNDLKTDFIYPVIRIGDIKEGSIDTVNCQGVNTNIGLSKYQIKNNDILLAMSGATVGKVGIAKNTTNSYINQRVGIIRTRHAKFLFYCLYTNPFIEYIVLKANGSAQPNVSGSVYGEFKIPFPPLDEQQKIVDYLDKRCGEIYTITAKIQEQITTLEEYKKSVISEAVTKGLNSNAPMKDSGIEWIGKIPVNWNVYPIYSYFTERKHKNSLGREDNLLSLSYGKIIRKDINTNGGLLPESFNTYNIIEAGDIIIRPTDLQNDKRSLRTGLSHEHGIITSAYIALRPNKGVNSRYFHYLLHTYDVQKVFYNMGNGVRQGLNYSEFAKLMVFAPSPTEQKEIADYLDNQCFQIEETIADKQKQIETLEEYKKTLIYEYVTGKKEVA